MDTIQLGRSLTGLIPDLKILFLKGPLGAGKTTLVKGLAASMGIKEAITSPSFALAQHYSNEKQALIHIDLYRLETKADASDLFLEEEEQAQMLKAIMVVEWPERLGIMIKDAWTIKLNYQSEGGRIAQFISPESKLRNSSTSL